MEVTKKGKRLEYEFACGFCGCEFWTADGKDLREISHTEKDGLSVIAKVIAKCPNCGLTVKGKVVIGER